MKPGIADSNLLKSEQNLAQKYLHISEKSCKYVGILYLATPCITIH